MYALKSAGEEQIRVLVNASQVANQSATISKHDHDLLVNVLDETCRAGHVVLVGIVDVRVVQREH